MKLCYDETYSNIHHYTFQTVLTPQCKKYWRHGDQSYIPTQMTIFNIFNGFSMISCWVRKSYSKSLLQRRNVSSWYFSRHKSSPGRCAKRGSLSRAEKILFFRVKKLTWECWSKSINEKSYSSSRIILGLKLHHLIGRCKFIKPKLQRIKNIYLNGLSLYIQFMQLNFMKAPLTWSNKCATDSLWM